MCGSNVPLRLDLAVGRASAQVAGTCTKPISLHEPRHSAALHLLRSGGPSNEIALWPGQDSTTAIHRYVATVRAMKERALAQLAAPGTKMRRFLAPDALKWPLRVVEPLLVAEARTPAVYPEQYVDLP
jgi:hypothetical protein